VRLARLLATVSALALAGGCLTACQTHVGAAAFVGSQRISESAVNAYIGPNAQETTDPSSGDVINLKSEVLDLLIAEKLFAAVFTTLPGGGPSASVVAAGRAAEAKQSGITVAQVTATGLRANYLDLYIAAQTDFTLLSSAVKDTGDGTALLAAIGKAKQVVRVNPRYGTWSLSQLGVSPGPAPLPFLKIDSTTVPAATDTTADGSG
jgi:hypothetical protein